MKYFTIIALILSFNSFANVFEKINCASYEPTKYLNKTVLKGTVKSEVTEVGVKEFLESTQNDSKPRIWKLELLDRATGKYKKSFPRSSPYSDEKTAIEHQIIQPHVVINLGEKSITGSNNGEFGGELLLIDENDKITLIERMNVKDIFEAVASYVFEGYFQSLAPEYPKFSQKITPDTIAGAANDVLISLSGGARTKRASAVMDALELLDGDKLSPPPRFRQIPQPLCVVSGESQQPLNQWLPHTIHNLDV